MLVNMVLGEEIWLNQVVGMEDKNIVGKVRDHQFWGKSLK